MPALDATLVKAFSDAGSAALMFFALVVVLWAGFKYLEVLREIASSFQEQVGAQHEQIRVLSGEVVRTVQALDATVQGVVKTVQGLDFTVQRLDTSLSHIQEQIKPRVNADPRSL